MNKPVTSAGQTLARDLWGAYAPGVERDEPVQQRIAGVEAEARAAVLDDISAKVAGLPVPEDAPELGAYAKGWYSGWGDAASAILALIDAARGEPTPTQEGGR